MTKRIALFLVLAMMAVLTVSAVAQSTTVQGTCKDEAGKLIVGATVELSNLEKGAKVTSKTDSHGRYSTSAPVGTYKINLISADGTLLFYINNALLRFGGENTYDIDLSKVAKTSGVTEAQRKQMEKAKKDSENIKGLNAQLLLAANQKKDGNFDGAVATLEHVLAQDQTHDIIYGALGEAYLLDKKYPEAETTYTKAIELAAPTSKAIGSYHNGLAQALVKQGKTAPAMAEYDKAVQLDPANGSMYYFNEGAVLTNQGKADEANRAFDKAIAADPTRPEPYYQKGVNLLSKATLKDGKMVPVPGTVESLNKYLELAPDGKYAQPAKDLLASMGASVQTNFGTKKAGKK